MKKLSMAFVMLIAMNANAQWVLQNTGSTTDFHSVKFINKNTGWICGTGVIAKTTNAGVNWVQQTHPATNKRLDCISVVDSSTLYCVGMFKTILKTTNGGTNWLAIQNGPFGTGDSYKAVFFINSNTGWISGSGQKMWKTTNGGDSLIQIYIADWVNYIYFKDATTGVLCGDGGFLQRTTNGGYNWYTPNIELHYMGYTFYKFSIINNQYCWLVGMSGPIYRSTDFGSNWDSIGFIPEHFDALYSIKFSNFNTGWCGGGGVGQGRLFKTTNSGYTWVRQLNLTIPGYIGDIYFHNDSLGWVTGSNGMVLHTTNGGLSYVNQISSIIPKSFVLHQNYPNPFNSQTNIKFAIPKSSMVRISIFDILGKERDIILDGIYQAGKYEINYSPKDLSSGIYFYKMEVNGVITKTKKLMLNK